MATILGFCRWFARTTSLSPAFSPSACRSTWLTWVQGRLASCGTCSCLSVHYCPPSSSCSSTRLCWGKAPQASPMWTDPSSSSVAASSPSWHQLRVFRQTWLHSCNHFGKCAQGARATICSSQLYLIDIEKVNLAAPNCQLSDKLSSIREKVGFVTILYFLFQMSDANMSRGAFISSSNFLSIPLVTCHRSTFWGAFIFKIATLLVWKMCWGKIEDFQNIKNWSSPNLKDHLFICLPLRKTAIRRTLN